MNNHEYIIPTSQFESEKEQANFIEPPKVVQEHDEHMHNYLKQIEANEYAKRRSEKSQLVRSYHALIERVRHEHLEFIDHQNKSARLGKIVSYITFGTALPKQDIQSTWNRLVEREALIGGSLLDTPHNQKHSYHYHDNNEWFWYGEDLITGKKQSVRFRVEMNDVYKSIEGSSFTPLEEEELDNFINVSLHYSKHVIASVYARTDLLQA